LPDAQGISPNGAFSLNEARGFFECYLTRFDANDRRGLIEFYPETREIRRLIVRLYLTLSEREQDAVVLITVIRYARHALESVRAALQLRYPDRSEEPCDG
jgi:hypothetical protein